MIMHSFDVQCVTHDELAEPHCIKRYEWLELHDMQRKYLHVAGVSKLNKSDGAYIPIKF
jgi:hypothetical protein